MTEDLQRRAREGGVGEDSIIIPQEPSLRPTMVTATSDDEKNNNVNKKEKKQTQ